MMQIDTDDQAPIKMRLYRRQLLEEAVRDMLESRMIGRGELLWSFPIVVVDKKDGWNRFCADFRKLISKSLAVPLLLTDDILALHHRSKIRLLANGL